MTAAYVKRRADGSYRTLMLPCPHGTEDGCCTFSVRAGVPHSGVTWRFDGPPDAPTVTPSIDCQVCGWHGHVVAGELRPARDLANA